MAIAASSIVPENSLEDFRIEFNNLVSDVTGITATNKFDSDIIFEGATADDYETTLTVTDPTADRTITLPNLTGTVSLITATETLTNKTLTTPVIAEIDSGSTITLDATTDIVLDADGGDVFFKDDGTTFGSATNSSGNLIIKSGTTTAATFSGANVTFAGTVEGTTITATTAVVPDASDGATLGTAALEWSDLYLADSANIYFGDDQEVVLSHNPDTGLLLKNSNSADDKPIVLNLQTGEQDIAADDVLGSIRFNAPDEGTGTDALLVSAAIDAISEGDFSSSSNATKLAFRTGASETATEKMALTSGGNLQLPTDATVLSFGADSEVTFTHVHNTGLLLNSTMAIQFNDSSQYINAPGNAQMDIRATDELELTATLIDINGNVEISGTTTQTGISTSTAKDVFNAGMSVKNGSTSAGFIEFFEDSDNGTNKVTLIGPSSTSDVTITLPSSSATLATSGDITALAIALG